MYFGRPPLNSGHTRIAKRLCDESVSTSNAPAQTGSAPTRPSLAETEAPRHRILSRSRLLFYSLESPRCEGACWWKAAHPANLPYILPVRRVARWRSQRAFAALADPPPSVQYRPELARSPARHPECLSLFRCVREEHREVFARWRAHSSTAPLDL